MKFMHNRTLVHKLTAFACAGLLATGIIVVGTAGGASAASIPMGLPAMGMTR